MVFKVSKLMFEGQLKKAYKTSVKHTIIDLGHALLIHHEALRIHKPNACHLECSWDHLGATCEQEMGQLYHKCTKLSSVQKKN